MTERSEAKEMARAAEELHEATSEIRKLAEAMKHNREGLPEEEADALASEAVHRARREIGRERSGESAPSPEEIRRRRDERREREAGS